MFIDVDITLKETIHSLNLMVRRIMTQFFDCIQAKLDSQPEGIDSAMISHALDKFYRKLTIVKTVLEDQEYIEIFVDMIVKAGRKHCRYYLNVLKKFLEDSLLNIRQALASTKVISSTSTELSSSGVTSELLTQLVSSLVTKVKQVLEDLMPFIQSSQLYYASRPRVRESFCIDSVREGLVVAFIHHIIATATTFCSASKNYPTLPLFLIISKMCLEFEATNINYLLKLTDKLFELDTKDEQVLINEEEMCIGMRNAAQNLLTHYVRLQGLAISQMLRKSVETKDWLHSLEPRTVRAVMKRVMEEIAAVETQVGMLFEEGSQTELSSDSSRKTHSKYLRSTPSNWSSHSLAGSHVHKLFSEKIEIMSPVEFSKMSILAGVIKISLKTLLECVRLRTFSRYGLQQLQVDTHYLQLYLWRFVADENLIHFFLDEVLNSAMNRCLDPVLMEQSVVEIICERG
uniref:Vacuolar protein sorting-associated protein 51 homolog n=2 Tax=Clastoptera arizonana TaxID=38151 RepID=A0A1B6D733_9HEMI